MPAGHAIGVLEPVAQKDAAGQGAHAALVAYVPAGQML